MRGSSACPPVPAGTSPSLPVRCGLPQRSSRRGGRRRPHVRDLRYARRASGSDDPVPPRDGPLRSARAGPPRRTPRPRARRLPEPEKGAGTGKRDQPDVDDKLERKVQPAFPAGPAGIRAVRRLVGGRCKSGVSSPPARSGSRDEGVPLFREVGEDFPGFLVVDDRPRRDGDDQVGGVLPVPVFPHAVLAPLGLEDLPVSEIEEGGEVGADLEKDASPVATVAAVGPAPGDELLPAKAQASPAAVPRADGDGGFIYEGHEGGWDYERARTDTIFRSLPNRLNCTVPSIRANRVWSLPIPTLVPGWTGVPRCLTMIDPAVTYCPPKRF